MARLSLRTWGAAALAVALLIGGSAYLAREQWRNEVAAAQAAQNADAERLAQLVAGELGHGRYDTLPALLQGWGHTEPTLALIRVQAANGFVLAEFSRPEPRGAQLSQAVSVPYGYQGQARLTLVTDLSDASARRTRFATELALADVAIGLAIVVVSLLLVAVRASTRRYRMLLAANQMLLGGHSPPDLLKDVCAVAVREGGFVLAWIGLVDPGPFLKPSSAAGPALGYLEGLQLSADPGVVEGRGPGGIAVRTRQPYFCNDFLGDPATAAWAERARHFGIRSSAALPLSQNGRLLGILSLYSSARGHFNAAEIALVEQMAADISLGLEHLRRGADLERSLAQLRQIESTVRAGAFGFTLPGRSLWCSAGAAALLGAEAGDQQVAEGQTTADDHDAAADLLELTAVAAGAGGEFEFDLPVAARGAPERWLRVVGVLSRTETGAVEARGMLQDISERKSLEVELTRAADLERQRIASELHDNLGQVLTGASLLLSAVARRMTPDAATHKTGVDRAAELITEAMRLCRTLAHDTAPTLTGTLGASLDDLARRTAATGLDCRALVGKSAGALGGEQALELYRIAQEAVTNALKHGQCKRIVIEAAARGHMLELSVRDDGLGFGGGEDAGRAGLGQRTMRYRAARAGGTIVFRNNPDRGATVLVRVRRFSAPV
jgi:signal transduction histidine kinase